MILMTARGLAAAALLLVGPHDAGSVPDLTLGVTESPARPVRIARRLRLRYLPCPITATTCRVILNWTRPQNFNATSDTPDVTWSQVTPTAVTLKSGPRPSTATADTVRVPRPADGTTATGTAALCHSRIGYAGKVCNGPIAWSVEAPVTPPDTATDLRVVGILVQPESVKVEATVAGQPIDPARHQVQFCAALRLSDDTIVLAENSPRAPCEPYYQGLAGYRVSDQGLRPQADRLAVHVEQGEPLRDQAPDGTLGPVYYWSRARVLSARYVGRGEWVLVAPRPLAIGW